MRAPGVRFTIRWIMVRIAVLSFPFLILQHIKSFWDWGAVVVLLVTYAGIEVAIRPIPATPEHGCDL